MNKYENLDLIGNARADSVINDLPPAPTGRKGRPAKHGRRLSIYEDFVLSAEKISGYYTGSHRVLTNIFGERRVMAYVTSAGKGECNWRLFFSTIFPAQLQYIPPVPLFIQVEYQNKLLRAENILVIMCIYGA